MELQFLQEELVNFKERQKRMQEEEERRRIEFAKMHDSVCTDDMTELSTQQGIDKSRRDTSDRNRRSSPLGYQSYQSKSLD